MIICQKEEFEIERDSYKSKFKLLNKFLIENSRLGGNKKVLSLNIDEIISTNKYLIETNENLKEEIRLLNENIKKFKKTPKSTRQQNDEEMTNVLNKKEIKELLKKSNEFIDLNSLQSTIQTTASSSYSLKLIKELSSVCDTLLDALNDKHVALQHQRKCNKLLATRIQDLELEINSFKTSSTDDDEFMESKLFNLINDLTDKLKIQTKEDEEEEDDESIVSSNYKKNSQELFNLNSKLINNEPFILNT